MSSYYPAFVRIKDKDCIVVGGGNIAERKVSALLAAGANVTVISDRITSRLSKGVQKGILKHIPRKYIKGDAKGCFLVIAATNDEDVNKQVAEDATSLINVVDNPKMSNFIVPAVLKEGDLTIAISTGGVSPSIARSLKTYLKSCLHNDIKRYLKFLKVLRQEVFKQSIPFKTRNEFLMFSGSMQILHLLKNGGYKDAKNLVSKRFKSLKRGDR